MGCSSSSPKVAGTSGPIDAKRTEVKPRPDGGVEESKADGTGAGAGAGAGANKDSKAAELQATLRSHGYTLGPVLGQGGFGQVNLCTDTDGKELAVKVISKANCATDQDSANMKLETELMRKVRGHENVVQLLETFDDRSNYFLVMELCKGGELMDRIIAQQHFSEKTASHYFRQMLLGLKHCHDNGVVHRDLKPENFLFDSASSSAKLKLTDFGLSYGITSPDEIIKEACGSAYYIAPEVFTRRFNRLCDVWSLGVILYLLLSGTVPFGFEAEDETQVYEAIQKHPLQMEGAAWSTMTSHARELVTGLLEKDPAKRYTVEQALVHPWVTGEGASDTPVPRTVIDSMCAFTARNKFKKEALKLIASTLSAADVRELREAFHRIDADHTGTITLAELSAAMEDMGAIDKDRLVAMMREVDTDGDGSINYEEFLTATTERQLVRHQNNIWWAFCEYDKDANGKISQQELAQILRTANAEEVKANIREFDIDGDGQIDFEEFLRMLLPSNLKYKISRY